MKDNSKFGSSQSLIDSVNEVLKGGQKKLDKNYNGKLDGEDFKKLRGVKEDEDDDGWYTHKEIHGKGAVSRADWKKGIRTPKDADAAYKKFWSEIDQLDLACKKKELALAQKEYGDVLAALKAYQALVA